MPFFGAKFCANNDACSIFSRVKRCALSQTCANSDTYSKCLIAHHWHNINKYCKIKLCISKLSCVHVNLYLPIYKKKQYSIKNTLLRGATCAPLVMRPQATGLKLQLNSLIANLAYSELMLNAYTLKSTNDVTYLLYYENIAYSELVYCV